MKSLYFASYAFMATMGVLIIGWAQYNRKKKEGTPLNLPVIKALAGIAVAMWIGAGVSAYAYQNGGTSDTVFVIAAAVGAVFVAIFLWQMVQLSRELDRNRKELNDLATRDSLTHSWNRRIFHETLQAEIARAQKSSQPLSLLMFDIDDFHMVNERYGYKIGDGILRELVGRIFAAIQLTDTVYRYGGEEIALLSPGRDAAKAKKLADSLTKTISDQPYNVGDQGPISITVSIGISTLGEDAATSDELLTNATTGLRISRSEIGNCVSTAA